MKERYISFAELPKQTQEYVLTVLGLPDSEHRIIWLKYVREYSYAEIAAEMHLGEKSVGKALGRAKQHSIKVARMLYPLADDRSKVLFSKLGWVDLPWPIERSRREANRRSAIE